MNLAQVVAAMAGGALLAIAAITLLKLHHMQHRTERERKIDAAVDATVAGVETFRCQAVDSAQMQVRSGAVGAGPPYGVAGPREVRSKRHLTMLVFSHAAGLLISAAAFLWEACRGQRARIAGAAAGMTATASAVTVLTLTPWSVDSDAQPPAAPVPSATSPSIPAQRAAPCCEPDPVTAPSLSSAPAGGHEPPDPSPSPSGTQRTVPAPASPELPAAPTSAGAEPSAPSPTPSVPALEEDDEDIEHGREDVPLTQRGEHGRPAALPSRAHSR